MTVQLLLSLLMLGFFSYCYVYIGMAMPASPGTELGAEQWPQIILGLLVILLTVHTFKTWKEQKANRNQDVISVDMLKEFLHSKLLISFLLVVAMAFLMEYAGFLMTAFCFVAAYCRLLGERRPLVVIAAAAVITVLLYITFSKGLSVMLPRGYGAMRDMALWIDSL